MLLCTTLLALASQAAALNNGVGLLPEMGFNTWYMLHNHLTYPNYTWVPGYVMSEDFIRIAGWFKDNGLLDLGYRYVAAGIALPLVRRAL